MVTPSAGTKRTTAASPANPWKRATGFGSSFCDAGPRVPRAFGARLRGNEAPGVPVLGLGNGGVTPLKTRMRAKNEQVRQRTLLVSPASSLARPNPYHFERLVCLVCLATAVSLARRRLEMGVGGGQGRSKARSGLGQSRYKARSLCVQGSYSVSYKAPHEDQQSSTRLPQGFHRATNGRAAGFPKATLRLPYGYPKTPHGGGDGRATTKYTNDTKGGGACAEVAPPMRERISDGRFQRLKVGESVLNAC